MLNVGRLIELEDVRVTRVDHHVLVSGNKQEWNISGSQFISDRKNLFASKIDIQYCHINCMRRSRPIDFRGSGALT